MTGDADAELVLAARRGDQGAWDALVDRYASRIWAVARAHRLSQADVEDVFQVVWLRLVTHLDDIREPDRVGAWLATTARRECLRTLRKAGRQVPTDNTDELDPLDDASPPVESGLVAAEREGALWQALEKLPDRCQRLLRVLMADPEPSYLEVSAALDMPIGSIGPTRGRCLERLRRKLSGITGGARSSP